MESASRSTSTPTTTRLSGDAALVLGLAATAMPFSHSAEDQSESWLRTLRLHGGVGKALAGLGMSEEQLIARAVPARLCTGTPVPDGDVVERVARSAAEFTVARGGQTTGTADLFFALLDIYGRTMDRALFMHGITRSQVFEALVAANRPS